MWSDRYNYYNIQSDANYSQQVETNKIVKILMSTNCFIQTTHQTFTNNKTFPWVDIIISGTTDGDFASTDVRLPFVNLISIVCSKGNPDNDSIYKKTFLEIAGKLGWKLFLEMDDDGKENIEIKHN